ncbi:MAG: hypothetical protein GTO41_05565 [Burkholderiales bacterium]|nr:hypothetical protein [Burkholderiales bacterium]
MEKSSDQFVDRLTVFIARSGLVTPTIALLEANKPLSFVSSQLLLMLQPIADIFVRRELTTDLVMLLADRSRLERLISTLETIEGKE